MADATTIPRKLWEHADPSSTQMFQFMQHLGKTAGRTFADYHDMHEYSISARSDFWRTLFLYAPLVYTGTVPAMVVDESAAMDAVPRWFQGVGMNFAENILFSGDGKTGRAVVDARKADDKIACTEAREGALHRGETLRQVTWGELRARVGRLSNAMRRHGVRKGDRIAVVASPSIDTVTVFLAAATLGAVFSSSSTDMGVKGILDRLVQLQPTYVFVDDWAVYNGKTIDLRPKMAAVVQGLKDVAAFKGIVGQVRFAGRPADLGSMQRAQSWSSFLDAAGTNDSLTFAPTDFSDPFIVAYSSGTTGQPKCIVHGIGGFVLNSWKEGPLHQDIGPDSTQLQYTTTGWIMFLLSVQALLFGTRMVIYDGSPFVPDKTALLRLVEREHVTHFGISPKYLQALLLDGIVPARVANLSSLRVLSCGGTVLSEALFAWIYGGEAFPPSVHLVNISGGTDLAGCFATGCPILPLYSGGLQCIPLGMAVKVYGSEIEGVEAVEGKELRHGDAGELVCVKPFPTMPLTFLGDNGTQRYFDSYFSRFLGVWTHGDFLQIHPATRQVIILGRADGVLNPGGVRFGSAEIYAIVDARFSHLVADSLCVGQRRPADDDERVLLFLQMKSGHAFTPQLVRKVKQAIRTEMSPRHVPAFVFETPAIPTTVNLKKVELPVKKIVSGKTVVASSTIANPECLAYYYQFAKDENLVDVDAMDALRAKI